MIRSRALAGSIGAISFGAGLLFLTSLRWLAFLGPPPAVWAIILLTGVPLGGLLLIRVRWLRERTLSSIALIAGALALIGLGLFLLFMRWINVPVQDLNAAPSVLLAELLTRSLVAATAFLPALIGYGLLELAAFRTGLAGLNKNSGLVYTLNLSGLLLSYLAYRFLLVPLGTTGLLALGLVSLGVSSFVLNLRRWPVLPAVFLCMAAWFIPGLEARTTSALAPKAAPNPLAYWRSRTKPVLHDRWTPHCLLTVVEYRTLVIGLYDGVIYWGYLPGRPDLRESPGRYTTPDLAFSLMIRPGDKVAVLGSGGVVPTAAALRAGAGEVYSVELVFELARVLVGPVSEYVEKTYNNPRLKLIPQSPRRFLEKSNEQFNLIVISSQRTHLGCMRELLDPTQNLFTREAFALMKSRLAPGGIVAISSPTFVDNRGTLFVQSLRELARQGFDTRAYLKGISQIRRPAAGISELMARGSKYLILAQKEGGRTDALVPMDNLLRGTNMVSVDALPHARSSAPEITDDHVLLAGTFVANLGISALLSGAGALALFLLVLGLLLWLLLRKTRPAPASPWRWTAPFLVGFNFSTLVSLLVYRWMNCLDTPMDAAFFGTAAFLGLAALGSLLLAGVPSRAVAIAGGIGALLLLPAGFLFSQGALVLTPLAAILAGTLLPRILKGPDENLVRVYVLETYGLVWGSLAALVVPVVAGFSGLQLVAGVILLAAAGMVQRVAKSETGGKRS
jgi:hypothetical protein